MNKYKEILNKFNMDLVYLVQVQQAHHNIKKDK